MGPISIARTMLDLAESDALPASLLKRLIEVSNLIEKADGILSSRQIVAMIVVDWRRDGRVYDELPI